MHACTDMLINRLKSHRLSATVSLCHAYWSIGWLHLNDIKQHTLYGQHIGISELLALKWTTNRILRNSYTCWTKKVIKKSIKWRFFMEKKYFFILFVWKDVLNEFASLKIVIITVHNSDLQIKKNRISLYLMSIIHKLLFQGGPTWIFCELVSVTWREILDNNGVSLNQY